MRGAKRTRNPADNHTRGRSDHRAGNPADHHTSRSDHNTGRSDNHHAGRSDHHADTAAPELAC